MAGKKAWRLLEFGQELPRLLIKTRFEDDGYDIQLTDLSRIWSESVNHEGIVSRAAENGCSIDPSENDQYQILLDKLDGAISGAKGTAIELRHDESKNNLKMDLSAPLPGSLPPLKWSIQLEQHRQSDIAEQLVRPLLQQANHLRHQVQFLVEEVTAKDRIIAKITDRLESSGNDLTTVFPGVSNIKTNRKRSQREQLASHVKGLADFDEKTWRASIAPKIDHFEVSPNLLYGLLLDLPGPDSSNFNENASGEWWKRLRQGTKGKVQHEPHGVKKGVDGSQIEADVQLRQSEDQSMEEDEFEKQETPLHLKCRSRAHISNTQSPDTGQAIIADDDETEDEDDLDAAPSHTSSSQTKGWSQQDTSQKSDRESDPQQARKLGALGGKTAGPSPAPHERHHSDHETCPPPTKRKAKLGAIGGKKGISASPEAAQELQHESPPPPAKQKAEPGTFSGMKRSTTPDTENEDPVASPSKPKLKPGAFGGRAEEFRSPPEPQAVQGQPSPAKPKHRLGTLGGKKQDSSQQGAAEERDLSSAPSSAKNVPGALGGRSSARRTESPPPLAQRVKKVSEEPEVEETPEQRANRKRESLKREMQEKHPVKKKRKF